MHLGDVIVQDYNVYGDGVNIAARLQSIAAPGSIFISEAVYQQVHSKLNLAFEDLGVRELKNIEHPIRLYRIRGHGCEPIDVVENGREDSRPAPAPSRPSWTNALLHPASLVPLIVGAYFLATAAGLPPQTRLLPAIGVIVAGVGVGRALALRTGKRAFFLIAAGVALFLAAAVGEWHMGTPRWLTIAGVVVLAVGLSRLRR